MNVARFVPQGAYYAAGVVSCLTQIGFAAFGKGVALISGAPDLLKKSYGAFDQLESSAVIFRPMYFIANRCALCIENRTLPGYTKQIK